MEFDIRLHMIVILLVLTFAGPATGFLLSPNQCVAPSPCICWNNHVDCGKKSLTDVPAFTHITSTDYTSTFHVYLSHNQITSIGNDAFRNLSSVNTRRIELQLFSNNINSIAPDAFDGIEYNIYSIDLHDNNLTVLPTALGKVIYLKFLYVQNNPIRSLDSSVMSKLGPFLVAFFVDMQQFHSWPMSINKLTHLQNHHVNYIPFNDLPADAFNGMSSLTRLVLDYTKLHRIPSAVCSLTNLTDFTFDNNHLLETNTKYFEYCGQKLLHLTTMSLQNDSLINFPNILSNLPSLATLYLSKNNISFIPSSVIPLNNSLTKLYLTSNAFTRIPSAINKLKNLEYLYMDSNKISTIEDNDLVALTSLSELYVNRNSIQYVAKDAFKNNIALKTIDLSYTNLVVVPEAVMSLPNLFTLGLNGNNVNCSCQMSYLNGWDSTKVYYFWGHCNNQAHDRIKQYVENSLPQCP